MELFETWMAFVNWFFIFIERHKYGIGILIVLFYAQRVKITLGRETIKLQEKTEGMK